MMKLNYCKGVIIAHGKCEKLLAEHIKSNLHLNIGVYSEQNGNSSIQIDGLMRVLGNNVFKNKSKLRQSYSIEEEGRKLKNFFIMPIMDLDDTTEEKIEMYKSGELFRNHWLSPYIIPIWNDKNLDSVLYNLGLISKIPSDREKGRIYRELFPTNTGAADIDQVSTLLECFKKSPKTNMDVFIKKCLENVEKFN